MQLEGIDHVALGVRDIERSVKWYTEVLGFERLHEGMWNGVPTFIGKGNTGIALFPAKPEAKPTSLSHRELRMLHLAFRAKSEVKHPKFAVTKRGRFCLRLGGEQRNPSVSFANKSRHAIPHAFMKSLKPENLRVPFHRSLDVAYPESYVINSFQLHEGNLQNCFDQTKES